MAITDQNGSCQVSLPAGRVKIAGRKQGYLEATTTVTLQGGPAGSLAMTKENVGVQSEVTFVVTKGSQPLDDARIVIKSGTQVAALPAPIGSGRYVAQLRPGPYRCGSGAIGKGKSCPLPSRCHLRSRPRRPRSPFSSAIATPRRR